MGSLESRRWTEFIVAHKRLPQEEIDFILAGERRPFESTYEFRTMTAAASLSTAEELEGAAAKHEAEQDRLAEFRERVRAEFLEKGVFEVDEEYIARRVEVDAHIKESWAKMIEELDLHDSDFDDDDSEDEDDEFFNNREVKVGEQQEQEEGFDTDCAKAA